MGIAFTFAFCVVLAVNGNPFLGDHTRCKPEPETEEMHDGRVKVETTVRLAAVQENRDGNNGDVRGNQRDQSDLPPGKLQKAARQEMKNVVHRPFNARPECTGPVLRLNEFIADALDMTEEFQSGLAICQVDHSKFRPRFQAWHAAGLQQKNRLFRVYPAVTAGKAPGMSDFRNDP